MIEIQGELIRWVNVTIEGSGGGPYGVGGHTIYRNIYIIPDPNVPRKGYLKVKSVRVKSVPLFGRIIDLRWKAKLAKRVPLIGRVVNLCWTANFEGDLVRHLDEDLSLKQSLIELKKDVSIRSYPEHGCWAIQTKKPTPVEEPWHCFKTVACYLLESSGK